MKLFINLLLFSAINWTCAAQSIIDLDLQKLQADLVYLASDYLEGRETGKEGELAAAKYISARFQEIGLSPKGNKKSYLQIFDFNYTANPHATTGSAKKGRNVIGYIDNKAATTVIIGAHYDHIGRGAFGSRFLDGPIIHNGADDNASGVAALLYLAKKLKNAKLKKNNYLFIAFSGEEMGLYGSKYFVKNPTIALNKVNYMLNMDMVGRLDEEKALIINGAGTSPMWKKIFPKIKSGNLKISTTDSGVGPSDHTSFYLADLPAIHFFTGTHTDYHKPSDDSEKINFKGVQKVADWMFELIEKLNKKGKLAFSRTKDEQKRKTSRFKVTLGIMPDYSYQDGGMRIDAVLDDRPAQKGGLIDGDIVLKMADMNIKDIYDYMDGLSKFEKGQTIKVLLKRDQKELEKEITF